MKLNDAVCGALLIALGARDPRRTSRAFRRSRARSTARRCFPASIAVGLVVCGAAARSSRGVARAACRRWSRSRTGCARRGRVAKLRLASSRGLAVLHRWPSTRSASSRPRRHLPARAVRGCWARRCACDRRRRSLVPTLVIHLALLQAAARAAALGRARARRLRDDDASTDPGRRRSALVFDPYVLS